MGGRLLLVVELRDGMVVVAKGGPVKEKWELV
jgi:hypothetical protein